MALGRFFSGRRSTTPAVDLRWHARAEGLLIQQGEPDIASAISSQSLAPGTSSLLQQLADEDLAEVRGEGAFLAWDQVHELVRSRAYASSLPLLALPAVVTYAPHLRSRGSLNDSTFAIDISGWSASDGSPVRVDALVGSMVRVGRSLGLLSPSVWRLLSSLEAFTARDQSERTPKATRRHWGAIRRLAVEADAVLDQFLVRSIVVTPDKLDMQFRKTSVGQTTLVEIMPGFDGAPERWLEFLDKAASVPEHFDIPTADGAVHVALSEPVRAILQEVKRYPGRRAAGARAEAFLLNPVAALGDAAAEAIDLDQFAAAKQAAGISFERFRPYVTRDAVGFPGDVGLEITTVDGKSGQRAFASNDELATFVTALEARVEKGLPLLAWGEYEFELDGDAGAHLTLLRDVLAERTRPPVVIHHDRIHDLSAYADRIVGVGSAEPFISAYIVKKSDEEGWFPADLLAVLKFRPTGADADVTIPLTPEALPDLKRLTDEARASGAESLRLPGCSHPLPIDELSRQLETLEAALRRSASPPPPEGDQAASRSVRPTLLIKGNIDTVEHHESGEDHLSPSKRDMQRPASLRSDVVLRAHQVSGIARLQQLFEGSPDHYRGVLMADDMGLGKTLQLLTFIAWAIERQPGLPPALIVAPVSLLDNWRAEIERFFEPRAMRVLTAYDDDLAKLRVPRSSIDAALQKEGLVRFLKPDWRGAANVVLTTYETLRDLEFSFAAELWSILVCDEAQKIKNPNAMVTRAAKKLNVRFRVACTGTPVENSLTDLWCLFDLIQPGHLGALNTFGRRYGRSIESSTDTQGTMLEELRRLIEPQVIRRTKADVAKDLPAKKMVPSTVEMSNEQRALYVGGIQMLRNAENSDDGSGIHHLGLLQHLRLVCADPRQYGLETFVPEDPALYRRKAPKMAWLLQTLGAIKNKNEKALVFAEHRDIQRLLQHYIEREFGFRPRIVNGDTSTSTKAERSRQKIIDAFQGNPGFGVIILSPLAVGFGVNIQAANHVIHYLRHWNPAKEDQATDRAYRIGQTRDVHVYCPLTIAADFKTFDVKLDELLERKRALAVDMLHGAGTLSGADIDVREILPPDQHGLPGKPITADLLGQISPSFFEALAATLWQRQGYHCHLTQQSDAGVDVVGINGDHGVLIQCKSSTSTDRQLGWEAVRDVVGGAAMYTEQFPAVRFERIGLTNQRFNTRAHERARVSGVRLVEQPELVDLVASYPLNTLDVIATLSRPRL